MAELTRIFKEIQQKLGQEILYYRENTRPNGIPVCDKQFDETTDDGTHTYFRFMYRNEGYVGVLKGVGSAASAQAILLPSYIESFLEKENELSKTEHLKRILRGEASSMSVYKYVTKYSVKDAACFVAVIRVPKLIKETLAVLEQYGGNSLDTVVQMQDDVCAFVKFSEQEIEEYRSSVDYAEFLAQSLKEELGLDVFVGVGPTVRDLKDAVHSYTGAENALRYADLFEIPGNVHSYREFLLIKILENVSETKLSQYLAEISDAHFKEVFEDEEMLGTAEVFLQSSLNVSETSRNLYMHRNTLLYRLDKIEKATGLNIRQFSDAVSFRVLTILYKLLKK